MSKKVKKKRVDYSYPNKFWDDEKDDWLALEDDFPKGDKEAIQKLFEDFNEYFECSRSKAAIYKRFRMSHPLNLAEPKLRMGKCKVVRKRGGSIKGLKLNGD